MRCLGCDRARRGRASPSRTAVSGEHARAGGVGERTRRLGARRAITPLDERVHRGPRGCRAARRAGTRRTPRPRRAAGRSRTCAGTYASTPRPADIAARRGGSAEPAPSGGARSRDRGRRRRRRRPVTARTAARRSMLRRWRRPTVKAGGTLLTPVGLLRSTPSTSSSPAITDADARRAGFAARAAVLAALAARGRCTGSRSTSRARPAHGAAGRSELAAADRDAIAARLARLDRRAARAVDRGDAAGDRRRSRHARGRSGRGARPREAAVQGRRAQAQGARVDGEPRGRLPALAARRGVPGRQG